MLIEYYTSLFIQQKPKKPKYIVVGAHCSIVFLHNLIQQLQA